MTKCGKVGWGKKCHYESDIHNHKSKLPGKFQHFNAIDGSIEMLKMGEFPKTSIKMKNCKTFYEVQTASCLKEIILNL